MIKDGKMLSDKHPYEEIPEQSGWELRPLNTFTPQPVRHFASISELVAYAISESPAAGMLVKKLIEEYDATFMTQEELKGFAKDVVRAVIEVLVELDVIPQSRGQVLLQMFDEYHADGLADGEYPGCNGDPETCPECGPSSMMVERDGQSALARVFRIDGSGEVIEIRDGFEYEWPEWDGGDAS